MAIVWAGLAAFAIWAVPNVESFDARSPLRERLKAMRNFDYVGTIMTVSGTGMLTAALTYFAPPPGPPGYALETGDTNIG